MKANTATVWICDDCMILLANGDMPAEPDERANEPLSAIDPADDITLGMMWDEHECDRPDWHDGGECDCERREFTWSACEGCNTALGGSRNAATIWFD